MSGWEPDEDVRLFISLLESGKLDERCPVFHHALSTWILTGRIVDTFEHKWVDNGSGVMEHPAAKAWHLRMSVRAGTCGQAWGNSHPHPSRIVDSHIEGQ